MNSVSLIGRLTRDPEVRYTAGSQMAVATFSIAINRYSKPGEEEKADFPRIRVFGRQAENCEKYLAKGRLVGVQGRIQTGSYTNRDGATVYTTDVVADRVEFLEWGDRPARLASAAPAGQQPQSSPSGYDDRDNGIPEGFQAITDDDIPF
jgi:single-strand DNA-binding protein